MVFYHVRVNVDGALGRTVTLINLATVCLKCLAGWEEEHLVKILAKTEFGECVTCGIQD